ncbi:MAG: winged helix DNA-binding protein [Oscillospiraceae bacterium]|nr:winged helix DNA-binding protein [Oscillospiraceae bacterium]
MTEWMGRYRPLISALVQHVNTVSKGSQALHIYQDLYLVPHEWQVLEYIVEHRDDDECMNNMIQSLAIPQSSFSRIQKKLHSMGLIERYQTRENRKNIILKPTELAITAYRYHSQQMYRKLFKPFFDELEGFSDEELARFVHALEILSAGAQKEEIEKRSVLIRLD